MRKSVYVYMPFIQIFQRQAFLSGDRIIIVAKLTFIFKEVSDMCNV